MGVGGGGKNTVSEATENGERGRSSFGKFKVGNVVKTLSSTLVKTDCQGRFSPSE